jgi:hypothetical protein
LNRRHSTQVPQKGRVTTPMLVAHPGRKADEHRPPASCPNAARRFEFLPLPLLTPDSELAPGIPADWRP